MGHQVLRVFCLKGNFFWTKFVVINLTLLSKIISHWPGIGGQQNDVTKAGNMEHTRPRNGNDMEQ